MTKIKNTKKGMAKKTLSISLVAAMLATSNVPVWATEFSDGSDVTFTSEAPVVEETAVPAAAAEEFTSEAPVVEEAAEEVVAQAGAVETNTDHYTSTLKVKMHPNGWDNPVTVQGNLKDISGKDVEDIGDVDIEYTWLIDGNQANVPGANGELKWGRNTGNDPWVRDRLNTLTYKPNHEDFDKDLSLMITVWRDNTKIYRETIAGGKVGAKDISGETQFTATLTGIDDTSYNGKEQKLVPTNSYTYNGEFGTITKDHITWNYEQKKNDFTNVTGDKNVITVTGTLEGTYVKGSPAYGYKCTTSSRSYKITKLPITAENLIASMKTTSVEFTGSAPVFGKSDVTLQVKASDDTKIDISDALKDDVTFVTKDATTNQNIAGNVGKGYTLKVGTGDLDVENKLLNNFQLPTTAVTATTDNTYEIVVRDLANCTVTVNRDFDISDLKGQTDTQRNDFFMNNDVAETIVFTGKDGKSFTLKDIKANVNVKVLEDVNTAVTNETTGVVKNAVEVSTKEQNKNVKNQVVLSINLTTRNLNDVTLTVKTESYPNGVKLGTSKSAAVDLGLPYIAKPYEIDSTKNGITGLTVSGGLIKSGEYKISYDDNVNAGTVTVTLTGIGSYAGSVKNYYFKINPATVVKEKDSVKNITMKNKVTINPANNKDASLYKNALELKIAQELYKGNGKVTLKEDTDYTVDYYYVNGTADETALETVADNTNKVAGVIENVEKAEGANIAGNKVCAVVKIKKGNFVEDAFVKLATIQRKSISNVTVELEKDTYTYTGKQIVPEVVVKDGNSVLEKGVDYSIQVKDNIDAGKATVTIKALGGPNSDYEKDTYATTTFTIIAANAADVTVTLTGSATATAINGKENTFAYNKGKQVKPGIATITLHGVDVKDQFDVEYAVYGDNNTAGTDAGSIVISPNGKKQNFTGTKTHLFNIQGTELQKGTLKIYDDNKKEVGLNTAKTYVEDYYFYYSGDEKTFADEVFLPANTQIAVKEGTDYEIKYIRNVDAGTGFVAVVAKGNYVGNYGGNNGIYIDDDYYVMNGKLMRDGSSKVIQNNIVNIIGFEIKATKFTAKNITVANGVYASGLPVLPKVTVTVAGKTLTEGKDYKLNVYPRNNDEDYSYPESYINATNGKPFYVNVEAMGGYQFDDLDGSNWFAWGIDKFDFAAADIQTSGDQIVVKNGTIVVDPADYTVTKDEAAGTVTVAAKEGSKNYTGSQTVKMNNVYVQAPVITDVKVVGNKATVVLSGDCEGADGYDYVISKANDYKTDRVDVNKNKLTTDTTFDYVQTGVYYAYCHAWTRGADGKKIFSGWSNIYPFAVTAITPDQPVVTSVKVSGSTVKVTYTAAANADGYDVVLGTEMKTVNGEKRPVEYGKLVKKNIKNGVVTATFKNVPKGTYYAGLHAWNRTSENGKKVFSPWSNVKKATVK